MKIGEVSQGSSGRVLALLQGVLRRLGHPALAQRLTDHIVRKLAHFCEYTLEGFLLMLCMRVYTRSYIWHISVPLLGGVLTALADETIQIYSPGRSSQVTDVWLDSAGVRRHLGRPGRREPLGGAPCRTGGRRHAQGQYLRHRAGAV